MAWSFDKPTEPGLYIACRGDVETAENMSPLKLVDNAVNDRSGDWPVYSVEQVSTWHHSFKFARLTVG